MIPFKTDVESVYWAVRNEFLNVFRLMFFPTLGHATLQVLSYWLFTANSQFYSR
jgi:hypothetical protein